MAASSPACTHSCRNTELSTWRAAGDRPNETFDRPSTVWTPGSSALIRGCASIVSMPSRRLSSIPVDRGRASGSKKQVRGLEAVAPDGEVVDRLGGAQLPVGGAGLAFCVDAGADDRGAVLAGQGEESVEPGARGVPLLEVDRVEDGPPADPLQRGLGHGGLGGVDDERDRRLGGEALRHLGHVADSVGAGVVDADVEEVGALACLVAGHGDASSPSRLRASRRGSASSRWRSSARR